MRIGKRKVTAFIGFVLVAALTITGWSVWGTDGLIAVTLVTLFTTLIAVGWLVAQSERRVLTITRDILNKQSTSLGQIVAVSGQLQSDANLIAANTSGEQAERLLRALEAGFLRADNTLDTLIADWRQTREQMLSSITDMLEKQIGLVSREVEVVGREVGVVAREMDVAASRVDSAVAKVSKVADVTEKAHKDLGPRLKKVVEDQNGLLYRQMEALGALYIDTRPKTGLPPTRFFSASPDLLRTLHQLIRERKPNLVLECGSGVSTIVMAYAMKENGIGKVLSLEHLDVYKSLTDDFAAEHGVSDWIDVIHAPLHSMTIEGNEWMWYSIDTLPPGEIDILLVDGPPSWVGPKARYPAVPALDDRLAVDALVVLDDYQRQDEHEIAELWMAEHPEWSCSVIGHEKGTAMIGKNPPRGSATHVALRHKE